MLIPSIDLLGGKIVQLVQGRKKVLEFTNFDEWIERFSAYPLIQLIDLDAAMGTGNNRPIVEQLVRRLPCQVGGGVRSIVVARSLLEAGARRIIVGSRLIVNGEIDTDFAGELAQALGSGKLVFAVDSKKGRVSVEGWRQETAISPLSMVKRLDSCCDGFLYTHIDTEGLMQGIPEEPVRILRSATTKQLMVAGGIATSAQIERLDKMRVDAVVGMAIYSGQLSA